MFALIDCNNFFVSCERLFRLDLEHQPVVVLSSNDGCAVARSNEAKSLGIPMGAPAFKYRRTFIEQGVTQFSANFELYGDISDRITRLLMEITPRLEVYSVDESFLDLSTLSISDYRQWGKLVRERIIREIGIPVSIGIAPTKTLAKLASERAKKDSVLENILELSGDFENYAQYLLTTPIEDIWGIGRRLSPKLKAEGVYTALDLVQLPRRRAGQLMGVHGRQMIAELQGTSCHPLEPFHKVRQSVMHGRMFGEDTNNFAVIEAVVASLSARATFRLRREQLLARSAVITLSTNRHKPGYQRLSRFLSLPMPTADTGLITASLIPLLEGLFNSQTTYHRANIMLYDLVSAQRLQTDLFGFVDLESSSRSQSRLHAFDRINERYGPRSVHYAAEDLSQSWEPKHRLRSPRYTTSWTELPVATIRNEV